MIKIVNATLVKAHAIRLTFSDGAEAIIDFGYLLDRGTVLTEALKDDAFFSSFFLELGALCWPNGLELSPQSLYAKAKEAGILHLSEEVA